LKRVMEGQDELRRMVAQLTAQRAAPARVEADFAPDLAFALPEMEEGKESACSCGGGAAVGRAVVRAPRHGDFLRRAAAEQAREMLAEAQREADAVRTEAVAYREEADQEIQALAAAASEARQRLLEEARTRVEVVHAAEVAMQRRLTELTAEVKRAEKRLESLNRQGNNVDTELVSRVRRLIHFTEPVAGTESPAPRQAAALLNHAPPR